MKLSTKIGLVLLVVLMLTAMISTNVFAKTSEELISSIDQGSDVTLKTDNLTTTAGKILALIRNIAIILGTIIIAVLGVKYMMGSVEEKAEYKKSFVPLIVGIVVVMAATSIATLLFSITD